SLQSTPRPIQSITSSIRSCTSFSA
ncbi:MAG: hypothetical protein AVDCRST_MAG86-930, partial [uncultured Truepera sp.]